MLDSGVISKLEMFINTQALHTFRNQPLQLTVFRHHPYTQAISNGKRHQPK